MCQILPARAESDFVKARRILTISRIDIFPTLFTAHHIVHLFPLKMLPGSHLADNGEFVWAGVAGPLVVAMIIDLNDEAVGTCWTEEHLAVPRPNDCVNGATFDTPESLSALVLLRSRCIWPAVEDN